jgi:hypothetical protein
VPDYDAAVIQSREHIAAEPESMNMAVVTPRVRFNPYLVLCAAAVVLAVVAIRAYGQPETARPPEATGVEKIQIDAEALAPTLKSELAKRYAGASTELPRIEKRVVYRHKTTRAWMSKGEFEKLAEGQRGDYAERALDENFYYNTGYGSPLSYVRAWEILAAAGVKEFKGLRTLDYGCGGIAPMRLQASQGADAVGVDIEPLFPLYYNQAGDQGEVSGENGTGKVLLVTGRWPAEEAAKGAVGGGYDVIISKNTLKKGYVTPAQPCDEKFLVKLGVADVNFCKAMFDALKPGGKVLIYNICGKMPADKYVPMTDGRCPFSREMLETVGFKVVAFDADDSEGCRGMARVLGWDQGAGAMNLKDDLFATYTLVERP